MSPRLSTEYMGGLNYRVPLVTQVPGSLELLSLASPQGTSAPKITDPASPKGTCWAEMTRGPEISEFHPSRGCLGAETIESSRSQGTWVAELMESRESER